MPKTIMQPIVNKLYCSPYEATLLIRRRPKVANGGGLVVLDGGSQHLVFTIEGCGTLGKKEELILKDGGGNALLLLRHTGGVIEALTLTRKWKVLNYDYLTSPKLVFTLNQANSCFPTKYPIRISFEHTGSNTCEVRGDFAQGSCAIVDAGSRLIAQIGVDIRGDFYYVKIMPGIYQAFVVGVIDVLDYIHGGSTRC